ncbi:MAG TPA: L-aspartate oxidase, partial [Planctomycetaceae bacterium]|nr:L-aspartate oxidase [Planctomycetaceae bacterium]
PGLWAAGEVSASGLHGANRLASNSLLESLVFGAHAGKGASDAASQMQDHYEAYQISNPNIASTNEIMDLPDITNSLKSLMWRFVGVRRQADTLKEALETIDRWRRYVLPAQFTSLQGWELQNMLTVARIMVDAAFQREESRGVHLRTDFPGLDHNWNRHLRISKSG